MASLSTMELLQLRYLARHQPLWGGHLQRGERLNDPDMVRWIERGWIEPDGTIGYRLTEDGQRAIATCPPHN